MSPPTDAQMKRIVGTLNERGQFRSLISLASTPSRGAYERVLHDLYRLLRLDSRAEQEHAERFYSIRRSKASAALNRYREIYAFDRTAVRIPNDVDAWSRTGGAIGDVEQLGEDESGYLNANVIVDGKGSWWVACQAPLPTTIHPFLMAILTRSATFKHAHLYGSGQHRVKASPPRTAIIVQLTGLYEGDVVKAHPYLPTRPGQSLIYDPPAHIADTQPRIKLTLDRTTPLPHSSSTLSTLTLAEEGAAATTAAAIPRMTLHHFAFAGWPDFGVPIGDDVQKLQQLIRQVGMAQRDAQEQEGGAGCEVWVHCSAGVGRTGTYIALASLLNPPMTSSSSGGTTNHFSHQAYQLALPQPPFKSPIGPLPEPLREDPIATLVDTLREQRAVMCQSDAQVKLLYDLVYAEENQR